jgi:hypothetical protein
LQLGAELDERSGLLDGVEHFAGGTVVELTAADSLGNFRECEFHCIEIHERRNLEPVRHVIAQSAGATQSASAVPEVVIAVFLVLYSRGAAVGSVDFDVATSFVLHEDLSSS